MWLVGLPGGLTVLFKADLLRKMEDRASTMKVQIVQWMEKVDRFKGNIGRGMKMSRKSTNLCE